MKKYILFLAAAWLLTQCHKEDKFNDLGGAATLRGVVAFYDTLNGTAAPTLLKNAKVYLKYTGSSGAGYIYSTTADALAQYSFSGIALDSGYTIYAYNDTGTVKYYGALVYPANGFKDRQSDTLKLYASDITQNVLHLIVLDSLGGRVPGVTAWVFNSPVLFGADTSAGRLFDMTTNKFGVDNRYSLAPGTYYLRVKTRIGNLDLVGEASVDLLAADVKTVVIVLRSIALNRNGIELTLLDEYGTPVGNAKTYCYRSKTVYLLDTAYNNSVFSLNSNASGFASAYIIDTGTYYFRSLKIVGADTLRAIESAHVDFTSIVRKTMTLKKQGF